MEVCEFYDKTFLSYLHKEVLTKQCGACFWELALRVYALCRRFGGSYFPVTSVDKTIYSTALPVCKNCFVQEVKFESVFTEKQDRKGRFSEMLVLQVEYAYVYLLF
jgi:hypothetical protein